MGCREIPPRLGPRPLRVLTEHRDGRVTEASPAPSLWSNHAFYQRLTRMGRLRASTAPSNAFARQWDQNSWEWSRSCRQVPLRTCRSGLGRPPTGPSPALSPPECGPEPWTSGFGRAPVPSGAPERAILRELVAFRAFSFGNRSRPRGSYPLEPVRELVAPRPPFGIRSRRIRELVAAYKGGKRNNAKLKYRLPAADGLRDQIPNGQRPAALPKGLSINRREVDGRDGRRARLDHA